MRYRLTQAPYLRRPERAAAMSLDVLGALVPICVFSAVHYGFRPVLLILTGMAAAVMFEALCCLLMRRKPTVLDCSAAVTGGIVGAVVSPMSPYWLPVAGAMFAIVVVKMPMGGNGRSLFNPAAVGIALLTLCFTTRMFTYPLHHMEIQLPLSGPVTDVFLENSPASQLMSSGQPVYSFISMFVGDMTGPIGGTAIAVLLAVYIYLLARRAVSVSITIPYLAACFVIALLFPRTVPGINGALLELCSGYLLFCGVFMLNDPVTSPKYWPARVLYGVIAGILVMSLRHIGKYEEGACFAVLIVNAFSSVLDRLCWYAVRIRPSLKKLRPQIRIFGWILRKRREAHLTYSDRR